MVQGREIKASGCCQNVKMKGRNGSQRDNISEVGQRETVIQKGKGRDLGGR